MTWERYDKVKLMTELIKGGSEVIGEIRAGNKTTYNLRMRVVESDQSSHHIKGDWDEALARALACGETLQVTYFHDQFLFLPRKASVEVENYEVVDIRPMKVKGKNENIPICVFEDVLAPDINALALQLFGRIDNMTIASALDWGRDHQEITQKFGGKCKSLRAEDIVMMGPHYSVYGTPSGQSFLHSKLGFISGLGELRDKFPGADPSLVRSIYRAFDLEPSTRIGSMFKGEIPEEPKPRARKGQFNMKRFLKKYQFHSDGNLKKIYYFDPKMGAEVVSTTKANLYKNLQDSGQILSPNDFEELWEMHKSGELLSRE